MEVKYVNFSLDLEPLTLILKLDLKIYLYTEIEVATHVS